MKKQTSLFIRTHRHQLPVIIVAVAVSVAAVLTLGYSGAATNTLALEAETGTLGTGGTAKVEAKAGASGQAVTFGSDTTPSGPTIYVATSGNDANNGTSAASPKKTIGAALSAASAGYTILVAPGTYDGNLAITKGGSAGKFITIRSQTKYGATIYGNNKTSRQSAVEVNAPYVRVQDMTITGAQGVRNGVLINADNVEIVGNEIHTICRFLTGGTSWQGGAGIDIGKSPIANILLDSNKIHDIGAPGSTQQLVHGMYIGVHVTNGRVTNNLIYKVEDFGLHPYDETESSGWQFINNTIAFTGRGILQAPNGTTRNNIVYNTRGPSYVIRGSGNVLSNNISGGTGGVSMNGVTSGVDPMFVNPATDGSGDFRLKPGSPAIDKGTATGAPPLDMLGITRPKGAAVDIGAYEQ